MGVAKRRKTAELNHVVLLLLVRLRAYSAKLFAGTKQRFSALNHGRQRGEDVLGCSSPGIHHGGGGMLALAVIVPHHRPRVVWENARHRQQSPVGS
jgi:hypothetical protein